MKYEKFRDELLRDPENRQFYDIRRELVRLGRLFERSRKLHNLPQQMIAQLSGIAQGDISRFESGFGERGPTFDTLIKLAHAQSMRLVVELVPDEPEQGMDGEDSEQLREAF